MFSLDVGVRLKDNLIIDLPYSVAWSILQSLIDLEALRDLHLVFCCSSADREDFLDLFDSPDFLLQNLTDVSNDSVFKWLISKSLRMRSIATTSTTNCSLMERYLYNFGGSVFAVQIGSQTNREITGAVIAYCLNITSLTLQDEKMQSVDLRRLLTACRHSLTELHIAALPRDEPLFDGVRIEALRFRIYGDEVLQMEQLVKLQVLQNVEPAQLSSLARACPHASCLSLKGITNDITESVFVFYSLVHLDLEGTNIGDELIESLGLSLFNLQSLNIQQCKNLTGQSLHYIHSGYSLASLCSLFIDDYVGFTANNLTLILEKCTELRTLSWHQYCQHRCYTFNEAAHNLNTLILGGYAINDANLVAVAQHCTELHTLCIFTDQPANIQYTDLGLQALVQGCPKLQLLVIRTDVHASNPLTPFALNLWRMLRPKVNISGNVESVNKLKCNVLNMSV